MEAVLRHERKIVLAVLVLISLIAWGYTLAGVGMEMSALETTAAIGDMVMSPVAWSASYAALIFLMWAIMMIAMMLPSAAPMVLLFAAVSRKSKRPAAPFVSTGVFALGYVACWVFFSLLATALQWGLASVGLMTPVMSVSGDLLGAAILIAAGLYQLTPVKHACLRHCRHPIHFISSHWRSGTAGAFRLGVEHGSFCLGCCWFLMGLLFFGGIMNLYWIGGVAAYVLLEKLVPLGHWLSYAAGTIAAAAGAWMMVAAIL